MGEGRICKRPGCDEPIVRKPHETKQNFRRREYCGKSCAATHSQEKLRRRRYRQGELLI